MTRDEILALRPTQDATAARLLVALEEAERSRRECVETLSHAERVRERGLLSATDQEMAAAAKTVMERRLAVDRLDALIPLLRSDHSAAMGRETVASLRQAHADLLVTLAPLRAWQAEVYPKLAGMIGSGLAAHDMAHAALEGFKAAVSASYQRREVREAGALGLVMPDLGSPLPRHIFSQWS